MDSVRLVDLACHLLPVTMRVPLKFGAESVDRVTCLRVAATVENARGETFTGWGETPLSVTWAWPSAELSYQDRYDAMLASARRMADALRNQRPSGHCMDIGLQLGDVVVADEVTSDRVPHLAALIIASAFDIAIHDAHGLAAGCDVYQLYRRSNLPGDLSRFYGNEADQWKDHHLEDYLNFEPPVQLPVWHLVGGLDPIEQADVEPGSPEDGYPVTLRQWIERDQLTHLKIKLRGNDSRWDDDRLRSVAALAGELMGMDRVWLSTDFNCTVTDPGYVNDLLDRWKSDLPAVHERILYVEQPFPHDLPQHRIDVHSVSQRKDLFLDESAHDWRLIRLGKSLGWSGVALKTCKTQTGALLSMAWAKRHGLPLMVQDLTNPMLAQIPHVRLAAHAGTIAGVESNGMQFYPEASLPEMAVHPGLYRRRDGQLNLSTIDGPGFGYRLDEVDRVIPERAF